MRNSDATCHTPAGLSLVSPSPGIPGEGRGECAISIRNPQSAIGNRDDLHPDTPPEYRERGQRRIRVLHIINSFEYGGAEAMLCNLLLRCDRGRFEPSVVALIDDLTVAGPVLRAGIPLVSLGMKPGVPDPRGIARLARHLRRTRPAVIQCWMDHSNLIGGLAARLASRAPVVWGVHHSDHLAGVTKRSTLLTVSACAALSHHVPARVVCCSEHGRSIYRRMGFADRKLSVIPNGFDVDAFRPDPAAGAAVRQEIGVGPDTPLVGLVARYDPLKDHSTFLRAAALLARKWKDAHFLLCGTKVNQANAVLFSHVESLGLAGRCHLLGPRRDVARVYAALDVATSSSLSEAFPLAMGEAMACGVPCVATDVGDCALMIGATGRIVPPADPAALSAAWGEILLMMPADRQKLGLAARQRVRERFEIGAVTRRYEDLYERLATHRASAASGRRIARKRELRGTPRGSVSSSPEGTTYVQTGCAIS